MISICSSICIFLLNSFLGRVGSSVVHVYLFFQKYVPGIYFSTRFSAELSVVYMYLLFMFACFFLGSFFGRIERVVIAGVKTEPSSATLTVAGTATAIPLGFAYDAAAGLLTVRKPDVCVAEDFDIRLSFYSTS